MSNQFQHSVKVPRLYKVAATIAKEASEGVSSVKQLVYGKKKKHPNVKAIYSMVTTLFQKSSEIDILLKRSQILEKESCCDPWLIKILIVELLWGRGSFPGQSKPENTVRGYEQIFKAHLIDKPTNRKPEGSRNPRYVRVNTLFLSTAQAVRNFQEEGWILSRFDDRNDYDGFLRKVSTLVGGEFMLDIHIPDLLIFPRKTEFYNHPAYDKVSILLQDKASCLPVQILAPPPGSVVLDMCAAPGMKTTHIAALLNNQGVIYAVEKDPNRFKTLKSIVLDAGACCVKTVNKDVLDCSETDFPGVEYILVDPSCTGSGMLQRYYNREEITSERLQKLSGFQIKILRTALTKYPDVKRVVYSTCSIMAEENEDVIRQVLETNYNFKLVPAKQFISGAWKNFGSAEYGELGAYCLYARPDDDFTNGFFVAVFERLGEGEENKFFNNKIFSYKRHIDRKERKEAKKLERQRRENEETNTEDLSKIQKNELDIEDTYRESSKRSSEQYKKLIKKKDSGIVCETSNDAVEVIQGESITPSQNVSPDGNLKDFRGNVGEVFENRKKKKHKVTAYVELNEENVTIEATAVEKTRKTKRKHKESLVLDKSDGEMITNESEEEEIVIKRKNNRQHKKDVNSKDIQKDTGIIDIDDTVSSKKKKKKRRSHELADEKVDVTKNLRMILKLLKKRR